MDRLYYLYYRIFSYYKKSNDIVLFATISTYICITGLLWINVSTILFFVSTVFYDGNSLLNRAFSENSLQNRFVITPLLIVPVFLLIFLLINKRIKVKVEEFESETTEERKSRGTSVMMYIVISVIMFILSITSPLFLE